MSEQKRRLNIEVNLDTSKLEGQATSATRKVGGILSSLKDDKGALAEAKSKVDQLVASVSASGSKLSIPMEQFRAAVQTTSAALDKMGADNAARLEALYPKYEMLKQKMMEAYNAGHMQAAIGIQNGPLRSVEMEIQSRERLDKQIRSQWEALDQLNSKVQQHNAATKTEETTTQSLSQKLAECKKRMQELAAAGQQNSKEYQEQSAKAKELSKAMQQVNSDAKPDAHVRLRTALMNAKQAMAEAEKEYGRGSVQFQQARAEAIRLQQAMNGMNKQVKNLAAPNATYQGIINGLSGISGAASAATGMMTLFGGESQQTAKAMAKLQSIMSITMGLQSMSMMLNKNSAVQLNIIGRLTTWWAACKAKAAASTTAETAAITANTAAQTAAATATTAEATATAGATAANVTHAASWRAVGIAIKSVPVFGWILAAITAVIAAVTLWIKHLEKARQKYKWMAEAIKETTGEYVKERNALDRLYKIATDANKTLQDRLIAIQRLKQQYPEYFKQLKDEAILAGNAADEYKRLSENIRKTAIAKGMQEIIDKEGKEIADWYADHMEEAEWLNTNRARYQELRRTYTDEYIRTLPKKTTYRTVGSGMHMHNVEETDYANPRDREIVDFILQYETRHRGYQLTYNHDNKNRIRKIEYLNEQMEAFADGIIEKTEDEMRAATEGDPLYYQRLMNEAQGKADNHLLTEAERKQARKDYYKYRRLYEKARFNPKDYTTAQGNADIAAQKIEDTEIKSERERVKRLTEYARQLEQARINIMSEGAAKRERQRLLNNQKEQDSLYNQMQSEIESEVSRQKALWEAREDAAAKAAAAKGKQYRKKAFNSGDILIHDFGPGDSTANISTGDVDATQINRILAQYGLLQDLSLQAQTQRLELQQAAERLAMEEYLKEYGTYEEKKTAIAAIYAEKRAKATNDAERMTLMQEEKAALDGLDFDDFVTNRVALAFGEVENLTQSTITSLIAELEKYHDKVTATFDPDKIEKFNKALADLKRAQAMGEGNIFQQFFTPDFLKERKAAQSEIDNAEKTHNDLLDAKIAKEEEVKKKIEEIIAKVKELTGQELTTDQITDGSSVNNIIGQLGQPGGNQQGATDLSGLLNNLGKARVELGQVTTASNTAGNALGQLKEAFTAKFTGKNGALAMVDTIVHGINDIVQGTKETINELASTADALGADTSVGSGWDKATTIIGALGDASAGATQAWESLKSGNVMGVVAGVTKSFTSLIKGFAALHDASRERTIQRLQDEIDELERLNRRIEHRLSSQYSKQASKSYNEEIRNLEKQRALIQQQIAAEEDKKDTDGDRIKEWKDQYEELGWKIEEYKDKALDAIIGEDISTSIDNFADALADSWGKTGDRARAAKDYVKSMLRQMVLEAMKTDLTTPIRKLREMTAKALDDDVVTEAEQKELEAFAQQLAKETEAKYKWADNIVNDNNSSQSGATTGTFATASQDSITELSGRAAAIHTSGEMRRELLMTISLDLQEMRSRIAASKENETEIRNLVFLAVGHLETIARNTNELYEMNKRLDKIEKNTRGL